MANPYHWNHPPFHWDDVSENRILIEASDTDGLQAGLASAALNGSASEPQYIRLSPSTYVIDATLSVPSYTTLDLNGAVLKGDVATKTSIVAGSGFLSGGNTQIIIKNGTIDFNGTARGAGHATGYQQCALRFSNTTHLTYQNLRILDSKKFASFCELVDDFTADNIYFNTLSDGLHFESGGSRHYITNIHGYCGDDMVAYTIGEFSSFFTGTTFKDFTDINVSKLFPESTALAVFKAVGGRPENQANSGCVDNLDGTFTVTTSAAHNLVAGDYVWVDSADVPLYNNRWPVDSSTEFTYTCTVSITGKHIGNANSAYLQTEPAELISSGLVGATLTNSTNSNTTTVTANTANTVTGVLSGSEDWDVGDNYSVTAWGDTVTTHGTSGKSYSFKRVILDGVQGSTDNIAIKLGNTSADAALYYCHFTDLTIKNVAMEYATSFVQMLSETTAIYENILFDIGGSLSVGTSNFFIAPADTGRTLIKNMVIRNTRFYDPTGSTSGVVINSGSATSELQIANLFIDNVHGDVCGTLTSQNNGNLDGVNINLNNFVYEGGNSGFLIRGRANFYLSNTRHSRNLNQLISNQAAGAVTKVYGSCMNPGTDGRTVEQNGFGTMEVFGDIKAQQSDLTLSVGSKHFNIVGGDNKYYVYNAGAWVAL